MDLDHLRLRSSLAEELLSHLRRGPRLFPDGPRSHAVYDTTFSGCFRVEIDHGSRGRVGIEHVGGDGVFDWHVTELARREPRPDGGGPIDMSVPPLDGIRYRVEVSDVGRGASRELLATLLTLDWGEPTPESILGRDGVIMAGGLTTEAGARWWTTWSPEPHLEPAKSAFFHRLLDFAVDQAEGELPPELVRAVA